MTAVAIATRASIQAAIEQELARGTGDLPVLRGAATEALKLAQDPELRFEDVIVVAESDPPLAARFLAVANSALYSRRGSVASVKQALVRLGTQATRDILYLAVYTSNLFDVPRFRPVVAKLFRHSVLTARTARRISPTLALDADLAFVCGLLHDVGTARCLKLASKHATVRTPNEEVLEVIDELHTRAGADLAVLWHLPAEVAECCTWHHEPGERPYPRMILAADSLAELAEDVPGMTAALVEERFGAAGLPAHAIASLLTAARDDAAGAPP